MAKAIVQLVDQLNLIFEDMKITKNDVIKPNAEFVQRVTMRFLEEFGYSNFLEQKCSVIELNEGIETPISDTLVIITRKLLQKISHSNNVEFGIMDIIQPRQKRVKKFLSIFVNFWLFCNSNYEMATQRQEEVMAKAKQAKSQAKEKNHNLKEIEDLRQRRETYDIQKKKLNEECILAEKELDEVMAAVSTLQDNQKAIKSEVQEQTKIKEELDQNVKDCEKERKRLEMLVKSDEMKQELEKEISRLKEEKDSKMLNVHDLKVKIQDYKNRLIHFQKNLKELLVVEEKHRHIQKTQQDIEMQKEKKEEKSQRLLCLDEELAADQLKLNELQKELASRENNWKKKKNCLEAEVSDYENEITKIRQGMSEEEIAASDLNSKIEEATKRIQSIKSEIECLKEYVREEYHKLKKAYNAFIEKLEYETKKVSDAFKKL